MIIAAWEHAVELEHESNRAPSNLRRVSTGVASDCTADMGAVSSTKITSIITVAY